MRVTRKKRAITSSQVGDALMRRFDNIVEIIFRSTGGFQNSAEVATALFSHVLTHSRFFTPAKRRAVALALYRHFYRGMGD